VGEFRPDVLHVHTAHAFVPLLIGRLRGVPGCVVSRRVSFPTRGPLSVWKYRRFPGRIIAVSGAIRDALHRSGLPHEMIRVIHSGYDPERFLDLPDRESTRHELGWAPGDRVILFVGALAPHKSIPTLLGAFQQVLGELPRVKPRLVLAGDGPLRARVEEEIAQRRLSPHVDLIGFREDVPRLMVAADVVALASVEGEGSPAVIKEAMACGRAVVAASHGGVEEILEDGASGLLVTPGSVSAFAEALMRILRDESLRAGLEERARRAVTRFDVRHVVEETEQLYRGLIGSS
jgi:glycosyltransferase involved in cell wall biosynthesis